MLIQAPGATPAAPLTALATPPEAMEGVAAAGVLNDAPTVMAAVYPEATLPLVAASMRVWLATL
jgi:hypothetical protein